MEAVKVFVDGKLKVFQFGVSNFFIRVEIKEVRGEMRRILSCKWYNCKNILNIDDKLGKSSDEHKICNLFKLRSMCRS